MRTLGNIIWLLFGGVFIALEYFISSILMCITIIGIPFGIQTFKLGLLALWPFGKTIKETETSHGCISVFMNVIWIIFGGFWISLSHLILSVIFAITIIGIPFAKQHFKLAALALTPFGREIVDK
jgi:uncharacterized membrane protein YccF (DUF307 family)